MGRRGADDRFLWSAIAPERRWVIPAVTAAVAGSFALCVVAVDWLLKNIEDRVLRAAMAFAGAESGIVVLLVTGLIIAKYSQNRLDRIRLRRQRDIQDLLARHGEPGAAIQAANRWPDESLAVAREALALLSGTDRKWIEDVLRQSNWYARLIRDADSAEAVRAARAVRVLGELENHECRDAVEKALSHVSSLVRFAARRATLINGGMESQMRVLRSLPVADLWERVVMFHSIPVDSPALPVFLNEAFRPGPVIQSGGEERLALIALELLHAIRRMLPVTVPSALARAENVEVRIRYFKALPYCATDRDVSAILKEGLHDADWRVRAMAARACASLRPQRLIDDLLAVCQSFSNPSEAAHAARALAALGGEAAKRLQYLYASGSPDTRRIAAAVLEGQLLHPAGVEL